MSSSKDARAAVKSLDGTKICGNRYNHSFSYNKIMTFLSLRSPFFTIAIPNIILITIHHLPLSPKTLTGAQKMFAYCIFFIHSLFNCVYTCDSRIICFICCVYKPIFSLVILALIFSWFSVTTIVLYSTLKLPGG